MLFSVIVHQCLYATEFDLLVKSVRENDPTLITIGWYIHQMGEKGAKALADALKTNTTVKTIDLGSNLGDDEVQALAEALKKNTTMTIIGLNCNQIGEKGAKALAEALKTNTTVKEIHLGKNQIGDTGAKYLAEALKTNTTVKTISLRLNEIGDEGAQALAEALKTNTTVTTIGLSDNKIEDKLRREIDALVERNKKLAETRFVDSMKVIMQADRSTVQKIPVEVWGVVASFLGYQEEFVRENLPGLLQEFKKEDMQSLLENIREKLEKRALALGLRSSKMGPGNTEEDLGSVSNDESPKLAQLRAVYEQEPEEIKKEFSFHHWLRMKSGFYDHETRGQNPKPSFEEWPNRR